MQVTISHCGLACISLCTAHVSCKLMPFDRSKFLQSCDRAAATCLRDKRA